MRPAADKTTLDNGVRILSHKAPHARSVSMGVWVNVGARDENALENGLSHFIEHMIFKGTRRRSAYQIAREFDAIGGYTNAFTAMENTCYHARVMDTHTPVMVDIMSDIFLNSVFDQSEVEKERPVICQEIGMIEDNPEEYVHVLAGRTYWGDNPLGQSIMGPRENIARFSAYQIKDFFYRFYQPERIVITAAGNLEHERFVEAVAPTFENIRAVSGFGERVTPRGNSVFNCHHRELEQTHLCLVTEGMAVTNPRRYAFSLFNTILGGNMSSRLFQQIRERRGLAYSVYSFVTSHVDTGLFGVYTAVNPAQAPKAVELIMDELQRLQSEPIRPDELRDAKEYTKGNLMLASESIDNQMVRLAQNEIHFGRFVPLQEVFDQIDAVTEEDILSLGHHLLGSRRMSLTLLGTVAQKAAIARLLRL